MVSAKAELLQHRLTEIRTRQQKLRRLSERHFQPKHWPAVKATISTALRYWEDFATVTLKEIELQKLTEGNQIETLKRALNLALTNPPPQATSTPLRNPVESIRARLGRTESEKAELEKAVARWWEEGVLEWRKVFAEIRLPDDLAPREVGIEEVRKVVRQGTEPTPSPRITNAPPPVTPVRGVRHVWRSQAAPAGRPAPADGDSSTTADPRVLIDSFIEKVAMAGRKITRRDIWMAAGYKDGTEFERFQRGSSRSTKSAAANFQRVLKLQPEDFLRLLGKKTQRN